VDIALTYNAFSRLFIGFNAMLTLGGILVVHLYIVRMNLTARSRSPLLIARQYLLTTDCSSKMVFLFSDCG